jgi:periplasmic protein TonB
MSRKIRANGTDAQKGGTNMFDKLIESNKTNSDVKSRKSYFVVSSLVLSTALVGALVFSIFAADYGLGTDSFEVSVLVAPVTPIAPEPPAPAPAAAPREAPVRTNAPIERPTRVAVVQRIEEAPIVPKGISTVQNTEKARPVGDYVLSSKDSDPVSSGPARSTGTGSGPGLGSTAGTGPGNAVAESRPIPEPPPVKPPPVKEPVAVKPPPIVSMGVVNSKALSLPKPAYSAAAMAVNADGQVAVQVTIDENGNVVSAKAVSGHPLLRSSAEQAARRAKFSPTILSNQAVKATGVITYNFRQA